MRNKYNLIFLFTLVFLLITSCSKDSESESLIENKLERMSGKDMLVELLIKNDNDINQLSRILDCSPSSLRRIFSGETVTTNEGKNQFKNLLNQILISHENSLDELDPKFIPLNYKLKNLIEKNYLKIGGFLIILIIVGFLIPSTSTDLIALEFLGIHSEDKSYPLSGIAILITLIIFILYIVLIVIGWFTKENIYSDNFRNTIDPIWELLK